MVTTQTTCPECGADSAKGDPCKAGRGAAVRIMRSRREQPAVKAPTWAEQATESGQALASHRLNQLASIAMAA